VRAHPSPLRFYTVSERSGIAGGALFGGTASLVAEQGKLGRRLAIVRAYYSFGETFPRRRQVREMQQGSTLLVSLDTVPPGPSYDSIAAGHHDAYIRAFLSAVNHAAVKYHLGSIYMCFEHEANFPNHHKGLGTPAEFVRAWDHIHHLAEAAHLDWQQGGRLHWVLILSHRTYTGSVPSWAGGSVREYWPGTNEVDIVGADGYDSYGCKPTWKHPVTPRNVFGPVVTWARSHGDLPVFLAEWADTNAISAAQVSYIQGMQAFVAEHSEVAAALYWDNPGSGCSYTVSGKSLAALSVMGHSAALNGYIIEATAS
jgi:hypothetical protein